MRSKRELIREMLENAVIESAKPNYKFFYKNISYVMIVYYIQDN